MKLGSLFDGSGGFPLAGSLCGIAPVWASEIEPYPIAVTRSRFPSMKHLGDVSKVSGAEIEPVDIITFGSPCQDMSIAGKRAGIKHKENGDEETTRSGLFMEAVRIIKEMRIATNGKYPTFAVWENVPGAFSSNRGEDFRIVLEELIKIKEPEAVMPAVPKGGWAHADCYIGDGWSLAYRVFDAQYWGVPQRRRRIYLVADFAGQRAGEILFEHEGLRGYFEAGRTSRERIAADAEGSFSADDRKGDKNCLNPWDQQSSRLYKVDGVFPTLQARENSGLNRQGVCIPTVAAYDARGNGDGKTASTITGDHEGRVTDYTTVICLQGNGIDRSDTAGCNGSGWKEDVSYTLNTVDRPGIACAMQSFSEYKESDAASTLAARDYKSGRDLVVDHDDQVRYIVRRLTPTECARLQGFPDDWGHPDHKDDFTDEEYRFWLEVRNTHAEINGKSGREYTKEKLLKWYNKLHSDSSEYKMWGNGIALPTALYVMQGIAGTKE